MFMIRRKGFTLVELLIVVAIIGLLALLALPRFFAAIAKTKESRAMQVINEIRKFAQAEESKNGTWGPYVQGTTYSVDLEGDATMDYTLTVPVDANYKVAVAAAGGPIVATPIAAVCGAACDEYSMDVATGTMTVITH